MKTNIQREHSHAIVLTPDDLKGISNVIGENYGPISFSASCSEGSSFDFTNINEILEYENPSFRRIQSMRIHGGKPLSTEECSIDFRGRTFTTCNLSILDHDDKRALKVADELGRRMLD